MTHTLQSRAREREREREREKERRTLSLAPSSMCVRASHTTHQSMKLPDTHFISAHDDDHMIIIRSSIHPSSTTNL